MVKIEVKFSKRNQTYFVHVNESPMSERPNARYADEKAKSFARYLRDQGMKVELKLSGKAA